MTLDQVLLTLALLLPAAPVLNLCRLRGFQRRFRQFPRALLALATGLLAWMGLAIALPVISPGAAALTAAVALSFAAYFYLWQARASHGRQRNLPPGPLTPAPAGPWINHLFYLEQSRRFGPVFKMRHFTRPMVCIVGLRRGHDFLSRHGADTVTPPMPFNRSVPGGFMRYMAPELHAEYRRRMQRVFADRVLLEKHAARAAAEFRAGLEQLARQQATSHPEPHISEMTFRVMAGLFFGIQPADEDYGAFRAAYATIDYRNALLRSSARFDRAVRDIERAVLSRSGKRISLFARFLEEPSVSAAGSVPIPPTDPTLLRNFIFLLLTSWIDVTDLLTWVLRFLAADPRWLEAVRHASSTQLNGGGQNGPAAQRWAIAIVRETLRLEQSEYLMRRTVRDIEFQGFRIPANWLVRICVRESHRDALVFDRPEAFDPRRFLGEAPPTLAFAPFGLHDKSCLGVAITLWAGQLFVTELAQSGEWRLARDGRRELGAFHWQPGQELRVSVTSPRTRQSVDGFVD